jgi:bisphosphoglycerate-independent phosphoglycerate mutase (AlkP superfamily)
MKNMSKKVALIILDGFGLIDSNPDRNAVIQAKTPTFDYLFSKTYAKINAS